jgi:hypothetical protein
MTSEDCEAPGYGFGRLAIFGEKRTFPVPAAARIVQLCAA